jgi:hypothetical protein
MWISFLYRQDGSLRLQRFVIKDHRRRRNAIMPETRQFNS